MTEAERLKGIIRDLLAAYDAKRAVDLDLLAMEEGLSDKRAENWTEEDHAELNRLFAEAQDAAEGFQRVRTLAEEASKP